MNDLDDISHIRSRAMMYCGGSLLSMVSMLIRSALESKTSDINWVTLRIAADSIVEIELRGNTPAIASLELLNNCDWDLSLMALVALSESLEIERCQIGMSWKQSFEKGRPLSQPCVQESSSFAGLHIRFRADPSIFQENRLNFHACCSETRTIAVFHSQIIIQIEDQFGLLQRFQYPNGIEDLMREICRDADPVQYRFESGEASLTATILISAPRSQCAQILVFANGIPIYSGTPFVGLKRGFAAVRHLRNRPREVGFLFEGRVIIMFLHLPAEDWQSSVRDRIGNERISGFVRQIFVDQWPK